MHKSMIIPQFTAFFIVIPAFAAPFVVLYAFIIVENIGKAKKKNGRVTFVISVCDTVHYRKIRD